MMLVFGKGKFLIKDSSEEVEVRVMESIVRSGQY